VGSIDTVMACVRWPFGCRCWSRAAVAVLLCLAVNALLAAPSSAQEIVAADPAPATSCLLDGYVRDPSGRLAPGARVILVEATTRITRIGIASPVTGYFKFDNVPFGEYTLRARLGPLEFEQVITLTPQQPRQRREITLSVLWHETIAVSEEPLTVLQSDLQLTPLQSDVATTTFSHDSLEGQVLANSRSLQAAQAQAPGVVVTESLGTLAQFTAIGQRRFANRLTIDGASADLAIDSSGRGIGQAGSWALPALTTLGSTQTLVSSTAIQQIQVRTTNAAPEHANTPGAQTSVLTRSGSNRFSGWIFIDTRPNRLAAADWFATPDTMPRQTSINFGESLGGPVWRGRVFFFAAAEFLRIDRSVATTVQVPSLEAREQASDAARVLLDSFPRPNGPERYNALADFSNQFPVRSRADSANLRIDARVAHAQYAFVRLHNGTSSGDELSGGSIRLPALSFSERAATSTQTLTFGLNSRPSRLHHELRLNLTRHRGEVVASQSPFAAAPIPIDLLLPTGMTEEEAAVSVRLMSSQAGDLMWGRMVDGAQRQFQIASTLSYAFGSHALRFGGSYTQVTASTSPAPLLYRYRFNSVENLLRDQVNVLSVLHRQPAKALRQTLATFVQDTWRPGPRVSLNYGLRYSVRPAPVSTTELQPMLIDYETLPEINTRRTGTRLWETSWGDFQSHVSLAALLNRTEGRETGLRAGWSVVFDDLTSPGASAFGRGYPFTWEERICCLAFPVSDDVLATHAVFPLQTGSFTEAYAIPEHLHAPVTYEWRSGFTHAWGQNQVEAEYVGAMGRRLIYWQAYQPDPSLRIQVFSNDATSDYHALLTQYRYLLSRGLQAQVNYAWSHAIDTDSGEDLDPHALTTIIPPGLNRGNADFDRRHVFHATLSYRVPAVGSRPLRVAFGDWQIDLVGIVQSGAPVSVTVTESLPPGVVVVRPDVVTGTFAWVLDPQSPAGYRLNPHAFVVPDVTRMGTLGRNTFRGAPLRQLDLAVSRSFRIGRSRVQFRLAAFNVLNVPNFGPPDGYLSSPSFGRPVRSYAEALGSGTLTLGGLVPMQQAGGPRAIQLGFRFGF
jgi:hypothetical protein